MTPCCSDPRLAARRDRQRRRLGQRTRRGLECRQVPGQQVAARVAHRDEERRARRRGIGEHAGSTSSSAKRDCVSMRPSSENAYASAVLPGPRGGEDRRELAVGLDAHRQRHRSPARCPAESARGTRRPDGATRTRLAPTARDRDRAARTAARRRARGRAAGGRRPSAGVARSACGSLTRARARCGRRSGTRPRLPSTSDACSIRPRSSASAVHRPAPGPGAAPRPRGAPPARRPPDPGRGAPPRCGARRPRHRARYDGAEQRLETRHPRFGDRIANAVVRPVAETDQQHPGQHRRRVAPGLGLDQVRDDVRDRVGRRLGVARAEVEDLRLGRRTAARDGLVGHRRAGASISRVAHHHRSGMSGCRLRTLPLSLHASRIHAFAMRDAGSRRQPRLREDAVAAALLRAVQRGVGPRKRLHDLLAAAGTARRRWKP